MTLDVVMAKGPDSQNSQQQVVQEPHHSVHYHMIPIKTHINLGRDQIKDMTKQSVHSCLTTCVSVEVHPQTDIAPINLDTDVGGQKQSLRFY